MNNNPNNLLIAYRVLLRCEKKPSNITLSIHHPRSKSIVITPKIWQTPSSIANINTSSIIATPIHGITNNLGLCPTTHQIHQKIYQTQPDIQAILQVGSPTICDISHHSSVFLPYSQWGMILYQRIIYSSIDEIYAAIAHLSHQKNNIMINNHSIIICAKTMWACVLLWWHLHNACKVQYTLQQMKQPLQIPNHATCQKAADDLLHFEKDLGWRDWLAWQRLLDSDLSPLFKEL